VVFCLDRSDRGVEAGDGSETEILDGGSVELAAGGCLLLEFHESFGIFVGEGGAQGREVVEDVALVMEMETEHGLGSFGIFL
jgi:hypothetical protein